MLPMVSLVQDDAIYFCANLRCLKPELDKEYLKGKLISMPTEMLVHINKSLSYVFMKSLPGFHKCSSVFLN